MAEQVKEEIIEQGGPVFDPPVYVQRYQKVEEILYKLPGIRKVVDYGCSEGKFIKHLKNLPFVSEIACVDVDEYSLENASRLSRPRAWDFVFKRHTELLIGVYRGSVAEKDIRIKGFDAVTCIELIEHLMPECLEQLPANIFGFIQPKVVIFTTPNSEFNVLFPQLGKKFRHWDHKFEWTREEFKVWCKSLITTYPNYTYELTGVGEAPEEFSHFGFCTQLAIFKLKTTAKISEKDECYSRKPYILIDENQYPARSDPELEELEEKIEKELIIEDTFS